MKLYREVKCSDRLPKKNEEYFTDEGKAWFHTLGKYWTINSGTRTPKVWLEPYELPTEEVREILYHHYGQGKTANSWQKLAANQSIKAITNLLKGER